MKQSKPRGQTGGSEGDVEARPLIRRTLTEQAYEILKEMILDQELEPGSRLNIDALTRRLGVSTSPLREALARLESERLAVSELYNGYKVAPEPTLDYLRDLIGYRLLVEGHCALVGAPQISEPLLSEMRATIKSMQVTKALGTRYKQYRKFVECDARFHLLIVESAGNQVILDTYRNMNAVLLQSRLYVHRASGRERAVEVSNEHMRILKAFEARNGEEARNALVDHLHGGERRLL